MRSEDSVAVPQAPSLALSSTNNYDTRQATDLHFPLVSLKKFQTGVHYMGVKIYNSLPNYITKEINTIKRFELLLKKNI